MGSSQSTFSDAVSCHTQHILFCTGLTSQQHFQSPATMRLIRDAIKTTFKHKSLRRMSVNGVINYLKPYNCSGKNIREPTWFLMKYRSMTILVFPFRSNWRILINISWLSPFYQQFRWLKDDPHGEEPIELSFSCKFSWKWLYSLS